MDKISNQNSIVHMRGIGKKFFGQPVFKNLELDLYPGNFYALLGRNGSGKSTLMRILAHREPANEGQAKVLGIGLDQDFCEVNNQIAYVTEATYFGADFKIRKLTELYSHMFLNWDQETAEKLAKGFKLDLEKEAGTLSRGQLVQASLVLHLSYSPQLILLDEVTSVLDASARGFLMEVLRARVSQGATVVLATNIVTEVQGIATSLILLGDHHVKTNAPTSEISKEFVKLKKPTMVNHSLFQLQGCIEVGLASDESPLYLISRQDLPKESFPAAWLAAEPITPTDIFVYLTRLRD